MSTMDFRSEMESERRGAQTCMFEGCSEPAEFRAPADPGRLREYLWFCLEHVRAYNASWNYHRDKSEREVEADRRRAYTWDRPTWRLGSGPGAAAEELRRKARAFAGFEDFASTEGGRRDRQSGPHRPRSEEEKALEVLDLSPPVDFPAIRRRYRELVKRLHPDATGGNRRAEERLKRVTQAYATLKALHA